MLKEILMPKLGLTMTEGMITGWLKREGDKVEKGEPLFEVMTEKINIEIESPYSGVLKEIAIPEGGSAKVSEVVAYMEAEGEEDVEIEKKESIPPIDTQKEMRKEHSINTPKEERIKISPLARRLAQENDIDITTIKGTGPEGRIIKDDIIKIISEKERRRALEKKDKERNIIPITGIRKVIAQRMKESVRQKPYYSESMKVRGEGLIKLRETVLKVNKVKVSYNNLIIYIVSRVIRNFPMFNAFVDDENIYLKDDINIGFALATQKGLMVPVVKNADQKSLTEIDKEVKTLIKKAQDGTITVGELEGGTFTISNLGMYGIDHFEAIINPPQVAILAVSAIKKEPVIEKDSIGIGYLFSISLTSDHRAVDGAESAKFLIALKNALENPYEILLT